MLVALLAALGYIAQPAPLIRPAVVPRRAAMRLRPRWQIKVGQMVPDSLVTVVTDGCAANDSCAKVSLREIVGGEGCSVLIGMPGAFTPTCNDVHLPQYIRSAWVFRAMGVQSLSVLTTNDQFILTAWKAAMAENVEAQDLDTLDSSITVLADPGEQPRVRRPQGAPRVSPQLSRGLPGLSARPLKRPPPALPDPDARPQMVISCARWGSAST